MEAFSAFLVLCKGNSQVTSEFYAQRPVKRSFDTFMPLPLGARGIMFSGCSSVGPSVRSPKYPLSTCTWVRWSIRPTVTGLLYVCLSFHPYIRLERFLSICHEILQADGSWKPSELVRLWSWSVEFPPFGFTLTNGLNLGFLGSFWRMHGGNGLKLCMLMYLDCLQNWLVYGHGLLILQILALFWFSETGQIWGFQAFWSCSVVFPHYGAPLTETGHIWGFWALSGKRVVINVAEAYFRCFASSSV